jgi:hypothetical protein
MLDTLILDQWNPSLDQVRRVGPQCIQGKSQMKEAARGVPCQNPVRIEILTSGAAIIEINRSSMARYDIGVKPQAQPFE